jgi:hypothetical protein
VSDGKLDGSTEGSNVVGASVVGRGVTGAGVVGTVGTSFVGALVGVDDGSRDGRVDPDGFADGKPSRRWTICWSRWVGGRGTRRSSWKARR